MQAAMTSPATNKLARTSLILGILALVPGFLLFVIGALVGLAAIITGAIALSQIGREGTSGQGQAIAGIILGVIAGVLDLVIGPFLMIAVLMILGPTIGNTFSTINNSLTTVTP